MGGIAGAAAGGYGGHALGGKAGHGVAGTVIGALAGAFAGHKGQDAVEDKWDEHKEKKKEEEDRKRYEEEEERRRKYGQQHGGPPPIQHHQGSGNRSNDQRTPGDFGGNFSDSSRDIRLDAQLFESAYDADMSPPTGDTGSKRQADAGAGSDQTGFVGHANT